MTRTFLAVTLSVLAALATSSCDKLKPPPSPKTGTESSSPAAPAPKTQDPAASSAY